VHYRPRMESVHPMYILLPCFVCLLGVLAYALAANPKASEMGRLAYACGLLVSLFVLATHTVRF
jgi:hypothetical protein